MVTEENAIESVLVAKQYMAVASLEVCKKLKEVGCCHNYQRERLELVEWIDKVNMLIRQLNQD